MPQLAQRVVQQALTLEIDENVEQVRRMVHHVGQFEVVIVGVTSLKHR
jgi:hypothetical protein